MNTSRDALLALVTAAVAGCTAPPRRELEMRGELRTFGGSTAVVFDLRDDSDLAALDALRTSPERATAPLYLWIDVGRNEKLAAARPEWIAGMGSHEDWRRLFPDAPRPGPGERVGVHPWTPIWYRAVLDDRVATITKLLRGRTQGIAGVFLDHVQGAPSACGCGNLQCRWTADYRMAGGPEKVEGSPSGLLVAALAKEMPGVAWIPVWVIECEEADLPGEGSTGKCGEVGCFKGLCWKESTKELDGLLAATDGPVAVLADAPTFGRSRKTPEGVWQEWAREALKDLDEIPRKMDRRPLPASRVIVVEPRPRDPPESSAAREADVQVAGAKGILLSRLRFEESWEPRLVPFAASAKPAPAQGHGHE